MTYFLMILLMVIVIRYLPEIFIFLLMAYVVIWALSLFRGIRNRSNNQYYNQQNQNRNYQNTQNTDNQQSNHQNSQQSQRSNDVIDVEYTVHDADDK